MSWWSGVVVGTLPSPEAVTRPLLWERFHNRPTEPLPGPVRRGLRRPSGGNGARPPATGSALPGVAEGVHPWTHLGRAEGLASPDVGPIICRPEYSDRARFSARRTDRRLPTRGEGVPKARRVCCPAETRASGFLPHGSGSTRRSFNEEAEPCGKDRRYSRGA